MGTMRRSLSVWFFGVYGFRGCSAPMRRRSFASCSAGRSGGVTGPIQGEATRKAPRLRVNSPRAEMTEPRQGRCNVPPQSDPPLVDNQTNSNAVRAYSAIPSQVSTSAGMWMWGRNCAGSGGWGNGTGSRRWIVRSPRCLPRFVMNPGSRPFARGRVNCGSDDNGRSDLGAGRWNVWWPVKRMSPKAAGVFHLRGRSAVS